MIFITNGLLRIIGANAEVYLHVWAISLGWTTTRIFSFLFERHLYPLADRAWLLDLRRHLGRVERAIAGRFGSFSHASCIYGMA